MKIVRENGKIKVQSDYNREFIGGVKTLGGKWSSPWWCVPEENEEALDILLQRVYGEGLSPAELVDLIVDLGALSEDNGAIRMDGKLLARRPSRDSLVQLGDGVVLVSGALSESGGSRCNPRVDADEGTIVKVYLVPAALYERYKDHPGVQLAPSDSGTKRQRLIEEREKLLRRIAEIEREIAECNC